MNNLLNIDDYLNPDLENKSMLNENIIAVTFLGIYFASLAAFILTGIIVTLKHQIRLNNLAAHEKDPVKRKKIKAKLEKEGYSETLLREKARKLNIKMKVAIDSSKNKDKNIEELEKEKAKIKSMHSTIRKLEAERRKARRGRIEGERELEGYF